MPDLYDLTSVIISQFFWQSGGIKYCIEEEWVTVDQRKYKTSNIIMEIYADFVGKKTI